MPEKSDSNQGFIYYYTDKSQILSLYPTKTKHVHLDMEYIPQVQHSSNQFSSFVSFHFILHGSSHDRNAWLNQKPKKDYKIFSFNKCLSTTYVNQSVSSIVPSVSIFCIYSLLVKFMLLPVLNSDLY